MTLTFVVGSCAVKMLSVGLAGRCAGFRGLDLINLALTTNARGGPGIVLASVAFDAGNARLFWIRTKESVREPSHTQHLSLRLSLEETMASSTLPTPIRRPKLKTLLWLSLGLISLFVFITSEVFLAADYPMYHTYRLQVIADRHLLIPHTICGSFALLVGPVQFSSRLRRRYPKLHRILGYLYAISVLVGAFTGIALASGRPGLPGTSMQAAAWIVCTTAAFITARNGHIVQHRQWVIRSYAVTFTFVSSRVLNLWPRYWAHLGDSFAAVGVIAFTLASLLIVEIGLNWHALTTRRA
jgi:hypothetical protein